MCISLYNQTATEPPLIMAVKEDGLWSKPLNSFGPGEFLSSDIGNVTGKYPVNLDGRFLLKFLNKWEELSAHS
jgi:hypothetical protein